MRKPTAREAQDAINADGAWGALSRAAEQWEMSPGKLTYLMIGWRLRLVEVAWHQNDEAFIIHADGSETSLYYGERREP